MSNLNLNGNKHGNNIVSLFNPNLNNSRSIPKKIHFVWLGKPPQNEFIRNMLRSVASNKTINDYEITVWTDNKFNILSALEKSKQNDSDYILRQLAISYETQLKVRHYEELFLSEFNHVITDEKITYLKLLLEREMIGIKNYQSASDILRFFILLIEGGIYFDVDVSIIHPLPNISDITTTHKGIVKNWFICNTDKFRNNIIASASNSWLANVGLDLMVYQIENLSDENGLVDLTWILKRFDNKNTHYLASNRRKELTIYTTGPAIVKIIAEIFIKNLSDDNSTTTHNLPDPLNKLLSYESQSSSGDFCKNIMEDENFRHRYLSIHANKEWELISGELSFDDGNIKASNEKTSSKITTIQEEESLEQCLESFNTRLDFNDDDDTLLSVKTPKKICFKLQQATEQTPKIHSLISYGVVKGTKKQSYWHIQTRSSMRSFDTLDLHKTPI